MSVPSPSIPSTEGVCTRGARQPGVGVGLLGVHTCAFTQHPRGLTRRCIEDEEQSDSVWSNVHRAATLHFTNRWPQK